MHDQKHVPEAYPTRRGPVNKTKILRAVSDAALKDVVEGEGPITHNFVSRVIGGGGERDGGPPRESVRALYFTPSSHR